MWTVSLNYAHFCYIDNVYMNLMKYVKCDYLYKIIVLKKTAILGNKKVILFLMNVMYTRRQKRESRVTFWTESLIETWAFFWRSSSTKSSNRRSRSERRYSESHFPCHLPSPVDIVIRRRGFGVMLLLLLIWCCSSQMKNITYQDKKKGRHILSC